MGKQIWLVPSDADRTKINKLKDWTAKPDLEIEDGVIQTYPHMTVISFKEDATVDQIHSMLMSRLTSPQKPSSLKLDLQIPGDVESGNYFWRTAYQPVSSINVSGSEIDKKDEIFNFFASTLDFEVVNKETADALRKDVTGWNKYINSNVTSLRSDADKKKYPHVALAYTIDEPKGKDRAKRKAIATSLTPKIKGLFPNGKITVDRIWIVDCPHSDPAEAVDRAGVRCIPTWENIAKDKVEIKLKDIPGFADALL